MKAKCIKADPLGRVKVGDTYGIATYKNSYWIIGARFAVNEKTFKEMFEVITN